MISTRHPPRRAMTLTELMISLVVLAILSTGATNLIIGGLRTDRVLLDSNRQVSEMELSIRRMTHHIRTGSAINVTSSSSFNLKTQADPNNSGQSYTITYTYDSSAKTLSETSTQYNTTNVIAYNVSAFAVTSVSASPVVLGIDMTISGGSVATSTRRTFQVLNRNS